MSKMADRRCPDVATVHRMLREQLPSGEAAALETHVESCSECQDLLDRLARAEGNGVAELLGQHRAARGRLTLAGRSPPPAWCAASRAESREPSAEHWPEIEGYEILGELGRGGSAVVYRARQASLDRLVALKMLRTGPRDDAGARVRLLYEARALARLRHPNIVQVYAVGEYDGCPYFSLEFVDGPTLAAWAGGNPQPPRVAAHFVAAIARAVEYAHRNDILHRDLKPANVLLAGASAAPPLTASGPVLPEVKVTDFGLAKGLDELGPLPEPLTKTGMMLGTPSYMAPEQARGAGDPIGPAADVYALGAILYELLTGRPPFRAATPLDTLLQVVHEEPVSVARLQPRLPRDLVTICTKCLEKEPARRYATADEMAADLQRFLNHEPIRARPLGPGGRASRWARRRPAVAGLLCALAAVAASAFGLVLVQWREAVAARERAENFATAEAHALASAQEQRDAADRANRSAGQQRDEAVESRRAAERAGAELLLDRCLDQCERGDLRAGLAGLRRGLEKVRLAGLGDLVPAFHLNLRAWEARSTPPEVSPFLGSSITSIAYSSSGNRILVGRWSSNSPSAPAPGQAQLWDPDGWTAIGPPLIHGSPVLAVAISPDDTRLLTAGLDGSVQLWDAATGKPVGPKRSELAAARAVAFSPDGKTFAAGGNSRDANNLGEVRIWETDSAKTATRTLSQPGTVAAVVYSPDGAVLATGCDVSAHSSGPVGGQVAFWDPKTGRALGPTLMHSAAVRAVAFNRDGKFVVTGGEDNSVIVWERETGKRRGFPQLCSYIVLGIAFGPDDKTILTGGGGLDHVGNDAQLWDLFSNRPLCAPMAHPDAVQTLAYRPDGRCVATGCRDGRVRIWKSDHLRPDVELPHFTSVPSVVEYSPDGKQIITAGRSSRSSDGFSQVWDAATGRAIGPALTYREAVTAAAFAADSQSFAVGTIGGRIEILATATGRSIGEAIEAQERIGDLLFDADGLVLTPFSSRGPLGEWNTKTGKRIENSLESSVKKASTGLRAPDGRTEIGRGPGGSVQIRDAFTGRPIGSELDHGDEVVRGAGYTGGGARIYTVAGTPFGDRGKVRLWNSSTGDLVSAVPHSTAIRAIGFRPKRNVLATGGWEGDVRLWETFTGRPIGPRLPCGGTVLKVVLSPDGRSVAAVGEDCVLRIWHIPGLSDAPPGGNQLARPDDQPRHLPPAFLGTRAAPVSPGNFVWRQGGDHD